MKEPSRTRPRQRGASMIETSLVFGVGLLVVLAGALVGFQALRNHVIRTQQQEEAAGFKTMVETAISRADFPRWTNKQDMEGFFRLVPKARTNPYNGEPRIWNPNGGEGVYYAAKVPSVTISPESNNPIGENNILGGFAYLWNNDKQMQNNLFTVIAESGEEMRFLGWVFYETDMAGNISAVVGGFQPEIGTGS